MVQQLWKGVHNEFYFIIIANSSACGQRFLSENSRLHSLSVVLLRLGNCYWASFATYVNTSANWQLWPSTVSRRLHANVIALLVVVYVDKPTFLKSLENRVYDLHSIKRSWKNKFWLWHPWFICFLFCFFCLTMIMIYWGAIHTMVMCSRSMFFSFPAS